MTWYVIVRRGHAGYFLVYAPNYETAKNIGTILVGTWGREILLLPKNKLPKMVSNRVVSGFEVFTPLELI